MDTYRRFLKKTASICFTITVLLAAVVGVLTYPTVAVFGDGFDEETAVVTLTVLLAGFCLARLLFALWDKALDLPTGLLLGLGIVVSLAVIPIRERFPFVLKGYVFPLLTGLAVPRLLLSLLPNQKRRRLDGILAVFSGLVLALLGGVTLYGSINAFSLYGIVICRLTALSLLWFAPLFGHYAARCGFGGLFLGIALWILPLFAAVGIFWETALALFPLGVLLTASGLVLDALLRRKRDTEKKPNL